MSENPYSIPAELEQDFGRYQNRALIVGVLGLGSLAVFSVSQPQLIIRSYLVAFMFWLGIALGSMAIAMLHHLAGGAWGLVIRRMLESASRTLPVLALLFLPIVFGLHSLYSWSHPEIVAHDEALMLKAGYLNVPFFLVRVVLYFAIWLLFAYFLNKWSLEQDRTAPQPLARRLQALSGPGLVVYAATVTFASVDWLMSLDPHWYSTIFGILLIGGQALSAICFMIAMAVVLGSRKPLDGVISPAHLHDLGKLMLTFVMLWGYFALSQYLIIWSGNLPEETPFYLRRREGGWQLVSLALILLHFVLPFLLLLSRSLKRNPGRLVKVALLVILMRFIDLLWLAGPDAHGHAGPPLHFTDPLAFIGIGGVWLWVFFWQLKKRPLMPINDPNLEDALAHGRHH